MGFVGTMLDIFIWFILIFMGAPIWMFLMSYMAARGFFSGLESVLTESIKRINRTLKEEQNNGKKTK